MAWVKIDDGFMTHPKVQAIGLQGLGLFMAGLCWSSQHLTDGRIPVGVVPMLAAQANVKPSVARVLVSAGLWHESADRKTYEVHDFLDYNRSRHEVEGERERWRKNTKNYRRRRTSSDDTADDVIDDSGDESDDESSRPRPDPSRPDPSATSSSSSSPLVVGAGTMTVTMQAARLYGLAQAVNEDARFPLRYAATCAANALREHDAQLSAYAEEHPDATPEQIAAAVLGCGKWDLIAAKEIAG